MQIRKGDTVLVRRGEDKGKTGRVLFVNPNNTVVVEGVNIRTKHQRPTQKNQKGGIVTIEGAIHRSNVALFISGPNGPTPTKISRKVIEDGGKKKKVRISRLTGEEI